MLCRATRGFLTCAIGKIDMSKIDMSKIDMSKIDQNIYTRVLVKRII